MNYSYDSLERDISDIITELAALRKKKGGEYADAKDTLSNYRHEGPRYCAGRVSEKITRLKKLMDFNFPEEMIEEEIGDIINIIIFVKILRRQEKDEHKNTQL